MCKKNEKREKLSTYEGSKVVFKSKRVDYSKNINSLVMTNIFINDEKVAEHMNIIKNNIDKKLYKELNKKFRESKKHKNNIKFRRFLYEDNQFR